MGNDNIIPPWSVGGGEEGEEGEKEMQPLEEKLGRRTSAWVLGRKEEEASATPQAHDFHHPSHTLLYFFLPRTAHSTHICLFQGHSPSL